MKTEGSLQRSEGPTVVVCNIF